MIVGKACVHHAWITCCLFLVSSFFSFSGLNPTHIYALPGAYTLSLIAFSPGGCSDTLIRSAYLSVQPTPASNFVSGNAVSCQAPLLVSFADASLGATGWLWDFGDGTTSTAARQIRARPSPKKAPSH